MTMYLWDIIADVADDIMRRGGQGFTLGALVEREWHDGSTFYEPSTPTGGYMVGGVAPEIIVPNDPELIAAAARYFGREYADDIGRGITYVGGWLNHDTGRVHVDVSQHTIGYNLAMGAAADRGELAIWDVTNSRELRVLRDAAAA